MADGSIKISTEIDTKEALASLKKMEDKLGDVEEKGRSGTSVFEKLGSGIGKLAKIGAVGLGALATGTIAIGKSALDSYADYEQLVGGVDTLFKDSSKKVQEYASQSYKTANMSANQYMETITGFSASLIQSLGGDTAKATELGNQAIIDMSDNANKMGSSMESIQNAYQGFAKGNFTMLDNLKLGYGGTKEEMQRLLDHANELNAQQGKNTNYTIDSFGDIVSAIHDVQTELDITGTTSKEASTTITGSLNTMKSAWSNLMTALADGNADFDVVMKNFVDSVVTFGKNVIPVVEMILTSIVPLVNGLVENLLPPILQKIPQLIADLVPIVVDSFILIIGGIADIIPQLGATLMTLIPTITTALFELLPQLLELGVQILVNLINGIASMLPMLITQAIDLVILLADTVIANLPTLIDAGLNMLISLVTGIMDNLPKLIEEVPRIINSFCDAIYQKLPQILETGFKLLLEIGKGLIKALPTFIANIPQIIKAMVNVWTLFNWASMGKNAINWIKDGISSLKTAIPNLMRNIGQNAIDFIKGAFSSGGSVGSGLIQWIINGISSMWGSLTGMASSLASSVISTFKSWFNANTLVSVGKDLIRGIWTGISNMTGWITNLIGGFTDSVVSSIKGFFGIHSPSRLMRDLIGKNIVKGIGVGVDLETPTLEKDINSNMEDLVASMEETVNVEGKNYPKGILGSNFSNYVPTESKGVTQNITIVNPQRTPSENARAIKQVSRGLIYG